MKLRDGRLADIAPTILDVMGLEKPKEMDGETFDRQLTDWAPLDRCTGAGCCTGHIRSGREDPPIKRKKETDYHEADH